MEPTVVPRLLHFVYNDRSLDTVPLPKGDDERSHHDFIGPVLSDMVASCSACEYDVAVPEVPSAAAGAPLKCFAEKGRLLYVPLAVTDLAPAYKAAERLDMKGLVLEIERRAFVAVSAGSVSLADVAKAFAGCPRVEALCDNYLRLSIARAPPPYNVYGMAAQHGAVLVEYRDKASSSSGDGASSQSTAHAVVVDIQMAMSKRDHCRVCEAACNDAERNPRCFGPPWICIAAIYKEKGQLQRQPRKQKKKTMDIRWGDPSTWLDRPMQRELNYFCLLEHDKLDVVAITSLTGRRLYVAEAA